MILAILMCYVLLPIHNEMGVYAPGVRNITKGNVEKSKVLHKDQLFSCRYMCKTVNCWRLIADTRDQDVFSDDQEMPNQMFPIWCM